MKPEGLLQCSQGDITGSYFEPEEWRPNPHTGFDSDTFSYPPIYA